MLSKATSDKTILSVSQITGLIKRNLEDEYSNITVMGELSGFKPHNSGHWYFNLKDSDAIISCCMWRSLNTQVFFKPQDGMKVIVTGRITVYPPRGNYQIDIRTIKPAGSGELQAAFEELKSKLFQEGLFDDINKKKIPEFPEKIALITAIDGAALKDMLSIAERRYPLVELFTISTKVQGAGAANEIAANINYINKLKDIDLIIVGRGGGSIEDLWAFNEEIVARAIFNSVIPVISAVGHEIDFTIADFVADLRAPTPSAAMELATPDMNDLLSSLGSFNQEATQSIKSIVAAKRNRLKNCVVSYGFRRPEDIVKRRYQDIDNIVFRIDNGIKFRVSSTKNKLAVLIETLKMHDIQKILDKGFVLIKQNSKFIRRFTAFNKMSPFIIKFADNEIEINKNSFKQDE
ncbi:MAG: exodeoxyribonuclease VII large subunit [Bacteroidota bacterium]|nr:exodeoxyribonuclease VII large subunit [Bacteroidota bacterium]